MSYIMKYGYIHFGFKFMNGIRQSTCIRFPVWKPWGFPYFGLLEDIRKCEHVDSIGKHLPSGYVKIAIENHHVQWENPLYMVIFHSFVSLPEGKPPFSYGFPIVFL